MWKKVCVIAIVLSAILTGTYAYNNLNMNAAGTFQLQKGTKVVMGKYNGSDIIWEIGNTSNNQYVLMSVKMIDRAEVYNSILAPNCTTYQGNFGVTAYGSCPITMLNNKFNGINLDNNETSIQVRAPFLPSIDDIKNGGTLGLTLQDRQSSYNYWLSDIVTYNGYMYNSVQLGSNLSTCENVIGNAGTFMFTTNTGTLSSNQKICPAYVQYVPLANQTVDRNYPLRSFATIDYSKIVFAADKTYGKNTWYDYKITPGTLGTEDDSNAVKLRIADHEYSATLSGIYNKNDSTKTITKVALNNTVRLRVNTTGSGMVSALLYDSGGYTIKKYRALGPSNGSFVDLDLTGIAIGTYQIAVINEEDNGTYHPAKSSPISNQMSLEIVEPHKINYTKQPQSGASAGKDYEYTKNVNVGQTIGRVSVNPQGVMPLTYTVETNGDNTYQNFEIDGLDSNNASSATSLNVKIKANAPDLADGGLKVGTYSFCISAKDDNGYPTTPSTADQTKVCTTFKVEKPELKIEFNDKNDRKKTAAEAATNWNETATVTPNNSDVKIKYTKVSVDIGLIDIDPDSGEITYKGNGSYGKVKIRATADDDPTSGDDNYNPAYTEKEIVIYSQVEGSVIPDPKSSDANVPTFTASDTNVKTGGKIGTIVGAPGTPDNASSGSITYTYGLKNDGDGSFFTVNSGTGVITSKANLAVGSYHITVTVSDKWSTKEIPVTVNVGMSAAEDLQFYETKTSSKVINTKTVNFTDTNVSVFATVKGSSNSNPVKYEIKDGSTDVIEVNPTSGAVTIHGAGTVTIVATKKGNSGQADARAELTFTVKAGAQEFIYTDSTLKQELPKSGAKYKAYEEVYAPNKTFQVYTAGNPVGSTVTYKLKDGSPTDVISVDSDGTIHILNASMSTQIGKVIVEATSHDPSGNYDDKTIELPITITKATQTVSFKEDPIFVASGKGSVIPVIESQDISSNAGGVNVEDTRTLISVSSSVDRKIAKTTDGQTITYDYDKEGGIDIPIHVIKQGNRNYEKAEADGTLHIMGPDESILVVSDVGEVEYGEHFMIESLQDDSASVNVQYTFTVDDTTYITNPDVNGNMAEFDAIKITGSKKVTVTITRTADSEKPLSVKKQITVVPKEIEITIEDKEKYKGEENPELTYEDFSDQLVEWNGIKDVIQTKDIKLSTTAKTSSPAGDYPIKGDSGYLNKTYPNYKFHFEEGTLTIIEENIEDDWYHLEIDDGNNTAYIGNWTNQNVNIISNHNEYKNMSLDQSTWRPNQVTVTKEGENNQSFWMKKDSGAITKEKQEIIRIDKTAPKVKGIKAKDTNNTLQDIINKLSGGIFFKPGTSFEITTDDTKDDLKVSGTKEIAYKLFKITDGTETEIKRGSLAVTSEKANITISEIVGKYKVCVTPTDNAGNTNKESCHELELKKIDLDVDKDGKPDYNDPDGDGCPDLNIKWKDPNDETKWIVINGDRDYDGIPDLNIDSDGDGKPDLNIDTDHDGKPDLNLVILKKNDWKPTKCVKQDIDNGILEEYCTGTSVKAVINVDTDGDQIPNINIDTNGDMKSDINIQKEGFMINVAEHDSWEPNQDYTFKSFVYDTEKIKPVWNIDTDGNGLPDVNVDIDGDGIPDINIDTDDDGIPNTNIDSDGDGIPDINIDDDGDGIPEKNIKEITEWKPNKTIEGDFPFDTMDFNKPDDTVKPNKPDESQSDKSNTSVKGQYNPATSMGGANTGDTTNLMIYAGLCFITLGISLYMAFKNKIDT